MKSKKNVTKVCLILMILSLAGQSVFAYCNQPYGYYKAAVDVDDYTYVFSPYFTNVAQAVYSWNHCGLTERSISPNQSSANKMYQISDATENFYMQYEAETYNTSIKNKTTKFNITINENYLPDTSSDILIQSIACHELGHSLGLDHCTATAVMNVNRNKTSTYKPQSDDISGVEYYW